MFNNRKLGFTIMANQCDNEDYYEEMKPSIVCSLLVQVAKKHEIKVKKIKTKTWIISTDYYVKLNGSKNNFDEFISDFFTSEYFTKYGIRDLSF